MGRANAPFKSACILTAPVDIRYRGRFAPSPTGALHFGSLVAAVGSWLRARRQGGDWLVRIEDIDPPREIAGASQAILDTLAAFGMESDEPVLWQHARGDAYAAALARLAGAGIAFPCACSRTQIRARGGHRGRCVVPEKTAAGQAWRFLAADIDLGFDDAVQGRYAQNLRRDVGDFVLRRADGLWAYQLAVVVDDAAQGITDVVRGADLLDSTPRQIALQQALALPTPGYAHLPVLLGDDELKLSKQGLATPVDPVDPMPALRHALAVLGVPDPDRDVPATPRAVLHAAVGRFELSQVPRQRFLRTAAWQPIAKS